MRIEIKTKNITLNEDLIVYINEKLGDLDKFAKEEVGEFHADLEISKPSLHHKKGPNAFYAELNLELPRKKMLRVEAYSDDLRMAINKIKDEFQQELKKYKGKKFDKAKKAALDSKEMTKLS